MALDEPRGESPPFLTEDGLSLYWDTQGVGVLQVATRSSPSEGFGPRETVANLHPYPREPWFSRNDTVMYYSAFTPELDNRNIYLTKLDEHGFGASEVVTAGDDVSWAEYPVLTKDELTIYFGRLGDVFAATRDTIGEPFSAPRRVDELSENADTREDPTWVSEDGCRIVAELNLDVGREPPSARPERDLSVSMLE